MIPANEQFDNDSFPVSEETVLSPGKLSSNFALTQTMPSGKSSLPFLKALYPDESIGWGYLWTLNNRTSHWTGSLSGMADKAVQMSESEQVYFGVCRTGEKGDEYQRATAETVRYVPGVYVDIDTSEKHQRNNGKKSDENLPTIAESTTALESMPFKPSIIIDTGGGLHVYWLFHELVEIDSDKERTQIQAILKGWESLLRSHLKGKELDHVADLPRILRIPGTINHKYGTEVKLIKPVSTEPLDSIPRYELEDFAEFIRPIEKHDSKTPVECSPAENLKDIASVTEALSRLPANLADDYNSWLKVGMICHAIGDCLLPIWEQWSRQSEKYEPGGCAEKWKSFKRDKNNGLAIGTLIEMAKKGSESENSSPNSKNQKFWKGKIMSFSDIEPKPIHWLWENRFPSGCITIIVGRPGAGKSFLTTDMAARISTGKNWPDGSFCDRGDVLFIACEDDPHMVMSPRLAAHNADVSKVHLMTMKKLEVDDGEDQEAMISLLDIRLIEDQVAKLPDCKMIVIDPIGSYLGSSTDSYKDNEVRSLLAPLAKLAEKYELSAVVVCHTRKAAVENADDAAMGSRAFTGISRAVWHVMPDCDDDKRKLLLPGKSNLSAQNSGLAYRIEGKPAAVTWEKGEVNQSATDGMLQASSATGNTPILDEATGWLRHALEGGPKPSNEIKKESLKDGISATALRNARVKLKTASGPKILQGDWMIWLPENEIDFDLLMENVSKRTNIKDNVPG